MIGARTARQRLFCAGQVISPTSIFRHVFGPIAKKAWITAGASRFRISVQHFVQTHRSEEQTSELQSLMRISYAVYCLKKKNYCTPTEQPTHIPPSIHHKHIYYIYYHQ